MKNRKIPFFQKAMPYVPFMTKEQLNYYYYWEQEFEKGNIIDIEGNLSYIFVYLYSVATVEK